MKRYLAVPAVCLVIAMCSHVALASGVSTPPPPDCKWCVGPPSPPVTPIPTIAPSDVSPVKAVAVKLTPTRIARNQVAKLEVLADTDDVVVVSVRFHGRKARTYKDKLGDSGTLVRSWRVPKDAPYGKGSIKITVQGAAKPYVATLSFEVVR